MSEIVAKEFDLAWARYWLKKYQKEHKMKEASLVAQLIEHQEILGTSSILGKNILVEGFFSFELLKKVVEQDLEYKFNSPKNIVEYNKKIDKKFLCQKIIIKIS